MSRNSYCVLRISTTPYVKQICAKIELISCSLYPTLEFKKKTFLARIKRPVLFYSFLQQGCDLFFWVQWLLLNSLRWLHIWRCYFGGERSRFRINERPHPWKRKRGSLYAILLSLWISCTLHHTASLGQCSAFLHTVQLTGIINRLPSAHSNLYILYVGMLKQYRAVVPLLGPAAQLRMWNGFSINKKFIFWQIINC